MNKTLAVIATAVALVAGLSGASAADDGAETIVKRDRTGDVRTKAPHKAEEPAPRFIKQSIDLDRVRYTFKRKGPRKKLRIVYSARNVLQANRKRNQQFRTDFTDMGRYGRGWIISKEKGPVEVWISDRGGVYQLECPRARVELRPGPRKERVVQVIPLRCIEWLGSPGAYFRSSATVLPFKPKRFVSSDRAPETRLVAMR